jgi:hypothetical protein
MAERQVFFCLVQGEDVCSGDELRRGGRKLGSENKACFGAMMSLSAQEYPFLVNESITDFKSGCHERPPSCERHNYQFPDDAWRCSGEASCYQEIE